MAAARRGGSRLAGTLFAVGCLAVLGTTFVAGVLTGRHWTRPIPPVAAPARARDGEAAPPSGRRVTEPPAAGRVPAAAGPPVLTFYQELTAPLGPTGGGAGEPRATSPAAAPPDRPRAVPTRRGELPAPRRERAAVTAEGPFTVQVGAYRARAAAERLRASLTGAGHEAYVVTADGPDGVHYRVRVGVFASREAASALATRLGDERSLAPYVTTR